MFPIFRNPNMLLRLEGLAVFVLALVIYIQHSFGWTLFWSTILLPDLALLGYLANPGLGATAYNLTHSKLLPCVLILISIVTGNAVLLGLSLIWFIHIGIDRLLGYGLKYPENFRITHLGDIGQASSASFRRYLPCGK